MNTSMQEGKMLRNLLAFITILILVSACAPTTQTIPVINNATSTSSPLPTADTTRTALPSETPTTSITPLPTISTFTPTFDVSPVVTLTRRPKAQCPKENPNLPPTFSVPN